jgi:hypothetical protein
MTLKEEIKEAMKEVNAEKKTTIGYLLNLIVYIVFLVAVMLFFWGIHNNHRGEYVKITKAFDNGYGKIGIIQYKEPLYGTYVVRYVKEVKYTNKEKIEFTVTYMDGENYTKKDLKFLTKEKVVREKGQFIEK